MSNQFSEKNVRHSARFVAVQVLSELSKGEWDRVRNFSNVDIGFQFDDVNHYSFDNFEDEDAIEDEIDERWEIFNDEMVGIINHLKTKYKIA